MIIRNFSKAFVILCYFLVSSCEQKQQVSYEEGLSDGFVKKDNFAFKNFPESQGVLTDIEDIFTPKQEQHLFEILDTYERETTREIAILSTPTFLDYEDPLKYATDVADYWGVGKKESNNGLLIVVSKTLKQTAISSGYGAEKALSYRYLDSVINIVMISKFRKDNYYQGILNAVENIKQH